MKRIIPAIVSLIVIFSMFFSINPIFGQTATYSISGRVMDDSGNGVKGGIILAERVSSFQIFLPLIMQSQGGSPSNPNKIIPILFVPKNLTYDPSYLPMIDEAMSRISLWYGNQLNGHTFNYTAAQKVIGTYELRHYCPNTTSNTQCIQIPGELGADPGDIFRVLDDLQNLGYPIKSGVIQVIFWMGGYGYAGSVQYSDLRGFAAVGDWTLDGIAGKFEDGTSTSNCDDSAWAWLWCNKDSQTGTIAHELGHAFGLPHPTDDSSQPGDKDYWLSTVMAVPWDFPNVVLLDSIVNPEKSTLLIHPFFK